MTLVRPADGARGVRHIRKKRGLMDQRSSLRSPPLERVGRMSSTELGSQVASTHCFGAGVPAGNRKGLGWLAVLLVPVTCCAAPLLVVALSAAGAAAWGGLGAGAAAAVAVVLFVVVRRRRYAACGTSMCEPPTSGLAPGSTGGLGA